MLTGLGVSAFSTLWTEFASVFEAILVGIIGGFKSGFAELLYEDASAATPVVSNFATFAFGLAAVGVALGVSVGLARKFFQGRVR